MAHGHLRGGDKPLHFLISPDQRHDYMSAALEIQIIALVMPGEGRSAFRPFSYSLTIKKKTVPLICCYADRVFAVLFNRKFELVCNNVASAFRIRKGYP